METSGKPSTGHDKSVVEGRERPKLRDQAYQAFTERLLARDVAPGQFISQRELVALTGLPLGAIRELIPRLEAEGLIRTVPQRGMQIAQVDLSLVKHAFQFRQIIEREAVVHFTERVSDAELKQWRKDHERVVERATSEPASLTMLAEAQAIDWGFHDRIIDSLGNPIVSNAYRVNSIKVRLIRREQTRLNDDKLVPAMKDHLDVIAAIELRDALRAQASLTAHIENARRRALGL